jgi:hypothetical protein
MGLEMTAGRSRESLGELYAHHAPAAGVGAALALLGVAGFLGARVSPRPSR